MKMKVVLCVTAIMFCLAFSGLVSAAEDVTNYPTCKYCGMDREKFAFSRAWIDYADGKPEGFCSLHCMAIDLAVHIDRVPKTIFVADYNTKELVDAEKAFWVIGGSKAGVMTRRAKWAFKTQEGANLFMKEFGGSAASFEQAMQAAYEDMYQDMKMIREKRAMKGKAMEGQKEPCPCKEHGH